MIEVFRVSTDSAGTKIGERGHYPFGETWYPRPDTTDKWKFTSYERDSESGLDYARFRYDITRLGRFRRHFRNGEPSEALHAGQDDHRKNWRLLQQLAGLC